MNRSEISEISEISRVNEVTVTIFLDEIARNQEAASISTMALSRLIQVSLY